MSYTKLDRLLWWMATMWLVVDSCTGFFISYGLNVSLSQAYKLLILFFIAIRLTCNRKALIFVWGSFLYISCYFLHLVLIGNDFKEPILMLSKFLSLLYLYLYFSFSFKIFPQRAIINSEKVMIVSWLLLAFNIIMGVMGYGIPTYNNAELGVKGFFFAGNELGGILSVLSPFMFYYWIVRLSGLRLFIAYMFVIVIGILIGTKTAILTTLLSAIVVPLLYLPVRKKIWFLIVGIMLISFSVSFFITLISEFFIGAIERWTYFYDTGGMNRLMLSGRDEFWELKKQTFFHSDINVQLFGMGMNGSVKLVEQDHLDALLTFGYIGLTIILSFFLFLLVKAVLHRHCNSLVKLVLFSDLQIIGIGFVAGHVWFSAMVSIYIALINAFVFVYHDGRIYEKIGIKQTTV